jgi:hypothetical protein
MNENFTIFLQTGAVYLKYSYMRGLQHFFVGMKIINNLGSDDKSSRYLSSDYPAEEIRIFIIFPARRKPVVYWKTMTMLPTEMMHND